MHPELLARTVQACREHIAGGDRRGPVDNIPAERLMFAVAQLADALTELVACKDLKDRAKAVSFAGPLSEHGENWKAEYGRMRADYLRRQPLAWEVARAALPHGVKGPPEAQPVAWIDPAHIKDGKVHGLVMLSSEPFPGGTPLTASGVGVPRHETFCEPRK